MAIEMLLALLILGLLSLAGVVWSALTLVPRLDSISKDIEAFRTEAHRSRETMESTFQTELCSLREQLELQRERLVDAVTDVRNLAARVESVKDDLQTGIRAIEQASVETVNGLRSEFESLDSAVSLVGTEVRAQVAHLQESVSSAAVSIETMESTIRTELCPLREQLELQRGHLVDAVTEVRNLAARVESVKDYFLTEISASEQASLETMRGVKSEIESLDSTVSVVGTEVRAQIAHLQEAVNSAAVSVEELKDWLASSLASQQDALRDLDKALVKVAQDEAQTQSLLHDRLPAKRQLLVIDHPYRHMSYQEFMAGQWHEYPLDEHVLDPDHFGSTKRAMDSVATGMNVFQTASIKTFEFTAKGEEALQNGGCLMRHGNTHITVVVDAKGKIVEQARVAGVPRGQLTTSIYSGVVSLAWMLVARDIKRVLREVESRLGELVGLIHTAEESELEAAFEQIRSLRDLDNAHAQIVIAQALKTVKEVRIRSRERLSAHANSLGDPNFLQKVFQPDKVVEDHAAIVNKHLSYLLPLQRATLLEAYCLELLGDEDAQATFRVIMREEALYLRAIAGRYSDKWDSIETRRVAGKPALIYAIENFAESLTFGSDLVQGDFVEDAE